MGEQRRCVFVANGQIQAHQVRTFLEAAGIASVLRGESLTKTHGFTLDGLGKVEVLVVEADAERSRTLLASADAGEFRLAEDVDVEPR
jgi:non-ribosomal peptide synthetase component E (peptide arylation enzyme)